MTVALDIDDLAPWVRISPGMRDHHIESARVMLDAYHAKAPVAGKWTTEKGPQPTELSWTPATVQMKSSHGNALAATEHGAYTLAVLAVDKLGWRVLGRTPHQSGADWFVVDPSRPQVVMKLEVSGIAERGSPGSRLNEKVEQGQTGSIVASGLAVVFRFADASLYSRTWR